MAVAENLGKDRRGNPIYLRDNDGAELLFNKETKYLTKKNEGKKQLKIRREKVKQLDDDLPRITASYQESINLNI